ncbi:MAG: hypothetical protein ACRDRR_11625 [Pseudonocardiaceae bacterium]
MIDTGLVDVKTDDIETDLDGPNSDRQTNVTLTNHDDTTRRNVYTLIRPRNAVHGSPRLVVTVSDHPNTTGAAVNRHPNPLQDRRAGRYGRATN